MAAPQNFRTALSGFNRDDVVRYIEYMNSRHESELAQLRESEESLRRQLMEAEARTLDNTVPEELRQQLAFALQQSAEKDERIRLLEAQLAEKEVLLCHPVAAPAEPRRDLAAEELEAYRRAERAETRAKERVNQLYDDAAAVLSDSALKLDGAVGNINGLLEQVMTDLEALQNAMNTEKETLQDTASAMYGLKIGE